MKAGLGRNRMKKNVPSKESGALLDAFEKYDIMENNDLIDDQYEDLLKDSGNHRKSTNAHNFEEDPKYQGIKVSKNSLFPTKKDQIKPRESESEIFDEDESFEKDLSEKEESKKSTLNGVNIDKILDDIDQEDQEIITTKKDRQKEIKKAKTLKKQQELLDMLFESRVKMQDMLKLANRLPYPQTFPLLERIDTSNEIKKSLKELKVEVIDLIDLLDGVSSIYHQKSGSDCTITNKKILQSSTTFLKENKINTKDFITSYDFNTDQIWKTIDDGFNIQFPYIDNTISSWAQKFNILTQNSIKGRFANIFQTPTQQAQKAMEDIERLLKRSQVRDLTLKPVFEFEESSKNYDEEIYNDEEFYLMIFREMIQKQAQMDAQNAENADFLAENTRLYLKNKQLQSKQKKEVDRRASKNRKIRYDVHSKLLNFMAPVENTNLLPGRDHILKNLFGLYKNLEDEAKEQLQNKKNLRKKVKKNPQDEEVEINLL